MDLKAAKGGWSEADFPVGSVLECGVGLEGRQVVVKVIEQIRFRSLTGLMVTT